VASSDYELTVVPGAAVEWPLPVPAPAGFEPTRLGSWPELAGRLEYVGGKLRFMPPCGDLQQKTAADVVTELGLWARHHGSFVVGGNEAGMLLGGEVRAADAAIFARQAMGPDTGGLPRVAPILAVEMAGRDEELEQLATKARWYLQHGVEVVWLLDPATRSARVIIAAGTVEVDGNDAMPAHPSLPGLAPRLADLFRQVLAG
jgi:Uma2 family endonuclease